MSTTFEEIVVGGEVFKLATLLPPGGVRPMAAAPLPGKFLRTQQQIEKILSSPNRTPGRQLWSGPQWIWSQGRHGSCNAQAIAGAVMRARSLRRLDYIKLSGSGLYAWLNDGVDRGSGLEEGRIAIEQKGVPIADGLDDGAFLTMRTLPKKNQDEAYRFRSETFRVDTQDELASGVALGMIGIVAVTANSKYQQLDRDGVRGGGGGMGNHSVGVCDVRIRNGQYEFDEFGSWGLKNGEGGYAYLQWDRHLESTNRYHSFFLIHNVIDDPKAPRI